MLDSRPFGHCSYQGRSPEKEGEMTTKFINDVRAAIKDNEHARAFYFPPNKKSRREMSLRLGREIGYGLEPGADIQGLYSTLVVSFSLDSTGVAVDAKEFFDAVREGMDKGSRT